MMAGRSGVLRAAACLCLGSTLMVAGCARPPVVLEEEGTRTEVRVAGQPAELLTGAFPAAPSGSVEPLRVHEVKLVEDNGQTGIFVKLSAAPAAVTHFVAEQPSRIVVDVVGAGTAESISGEYPVDDPWLRSVGLATENGRLRLSLNLRPTVEVPEYAVETLNDTIVAFLGEPSGSSRPVREQVVFTRRARPAAVAAASGGAPAAPAPRPTAAVAQATTPPSAPRPEEPEITPGLPSRRSYYGKPISLDLKEADIHNVLRLIAEVSKLNIVATDDVRGKVTLRLFEVPWDQALDIILTVMNLEKVQQGNVLRISTVERIRKEREEIARALRAKQVAEPLKVAYIRVNYTKASKLAPIINGQAELIGGARGGGRRRQSTGVLSDRGSVLVDEFTNTLIVRDIQAGIDAARELVRRLDIQTPQVLIESNIVEATTNAARELGIQWGYRASVGPQTGSSTGKNFPGTVEFGGSGLNSGSSGVPFIADFPALGNFAPGTGAALDLALGSLDGKHSLDTRITALEEEGRARIISRPRVITLNNVPAEIKSLTIIRVRLPSTGTVINTGAGGVAGTQQTATEQIETGITLKVTPQVSSDGYVLLEMFAKSSQADFTRTVDNIPTEITREATSRVLVRDGQTVVIGGIYRDNSTENERGIPFLRDIPTVGWLFRGRSRSSAREDLLVFITPHIVTGAENAANLPTAGELWRNRNRPGGAAEVSG